ncbi:MAG: hypothetical protein WC824_12435 [Bacteroidota bacterium]|jgi:uncharacterized protein YegL
MPKFTNSSPEEMDVHNIGGSTFQFSAAKISTLGASEYTLATIVVDGSGSVDPFWKEIKGALKANVLACADPKNPRADNLMLRVLVFDHRLTEIHGFRPVRDINPNDYDGIQIPGNTTALYDATFNGVQATIQFAKDLMAQQYTCNGAIFVITDGADNASKVTRKMVADALTEAKTGESMESLMPVLIGVNTQQGGLNQYLDLFTKEAGFQQFVALEDVSKEKLMKLGGFISQSISSQSKSLGTGGASKSLSF